MLRTSQKVQQFSVEQFNLQAPDRRAMFRQQNAKSVISRRRALRIQKWLDILLVTGCIVAAGFVAQDVTRKAYEITHHQPLTWDLAVDYVEDLLNLP